MGIRTTKLRLSRKLTYAAGLVMCFRCSTHPNPPGTADPPTGDMDRAALALVDHLSNDVQMTPLAIFARLFLESDRLDDVASRMFGAYDEFLAILDDDGRREHLDGLSQPDVAADPDYMRVRELGHLFQGGRLHLLRPRALPRTP